MHSLQLKFSRNIELFLQHDEMCSDAVKRLYYRVLGASASRVIYGTNIIFVRSFDLTSFRWACWSVLNGEKVLS